MIEFAVLGPLTVAIDGQPIAIPAMQHRLVGLLLSHVGKAASIDTVMDQLWQGSPPSTARKTTQVYIHRLRRLLGDDQRIRHTRAGYEIAVAPDELDEWVFDRLVIAAHAARAEGDIKSSARLLTQALDLWRGDAYADVETVEAVDAKRKQMEDKRLATVEDRAAALLDLGQHVALVGELTAFISQHPFRERPVGHLMLALYRSGRQAEALETYRRAHTLLTSELGVEPGPDLARLHQQILRSDPALDLMPPQPSPISPQQRHSPNQLPLDTPTFVGRTREIAEIIRILAAPSPGAPAMACIAGIGGLGKTTLAVRAARVCLDRYPDGCLFADLRGTDKSPSDPHSVLGSFLRALGVDGAKVPQDRDERLGLFRSTTSQQRILFVLDNAHGEAQVRPLLPAGEDCGVIITSRRNLSSLDGVHRISPDLFSAAESRTLLEAVAGGERLRSDPEAVGELVDHCHGLPLAVRIVAARLAGSPDVAPQVLARRLSQQGSLLDELTAGDLAVGASFMLSYQQLDASAATLLQLLGGLRQTDFTSWSCSVVLDQPEHVTRRTVDELVAAHLVTRSVDARYQLHDLVKAFTSSLGTDTDTLEHAERRLVAAYLKTASNAAASLRRDAHRYRTDIESSHALGFGNYAEAMRWLSAEYANLIAAIHNAFARGWYSETWQIAHCLAHFFRAQNRLDEWFGTHRVALDAAKAINDKVAEARVRDSLGSAFLAQHNPSEALGQWQATLLLYQDLNDPIGVGACHTRMGIAYDLLHEPTLSERHHRMALAVAELAADPSESARVLLNLGVLFGGQGRFAEARDTLQQALEAAHQGPAWDLVSSAHHNLAEANLRLGLPRKAAAHARKKIEISQWIRHPGLEARGWEMLADCLLDSDPSAAIAAWERALALFDELGNLQWADIVRRRIQAARRGAKLIDL